MKEFKCESNIGEGLFSEDPVLVRLNFPDGSVGEFELFALTPRRVLALRKSGVKFQDHKDDEEAISHSEKIISAIVHRGRWQDVEITAENKHNIVGNMGLTAALINASRFLAEEKQETESKNSEN